MVVKNENCLKKNNNKLQHFAFSVVAALRNAYRLVIMNTNIVQLGLDIWLWFSRGLEYPLKLIFETSYF